VYCRYITPTCVIELLSQTVKHIIQSSSSICHVYTTIRRNHNFLSTYACWYIHNDDRPNVPLFDTEVGQFVSTRGKASILSISKYRYYTALLALYFAYKSRSLHTFPSIVTNSNLALSSTLDPPEHIAHLENSRRQYLREIPRISGPRNGILSTIHLTII